MIDSVRNQTVQNWRLIVVDDGSTDGASDRMQALARDDRRITALRQPNAGAAAARNRGLASATGDWVLFLDADDTIAPDFLSRMLARARIDIDAVCCGYVRVGPDGRETTRRPPPRLIDGRFTDVTQGPPVILHSILLRRSLFERIGVFDPDLRTNEDWDLWARLDRSGARIAREPRALASYWATSGSLTRKGRRMVEDAATVLRRMAVADPRVRDPDPRLAKALPGGPLAVGILVAVLWSTAAAAIAGENLPLEDFLEPYDDPLSWTDRLAAAVLDGLSTGSGLPHGDLLDAWPIFGPRLVAALDRIGDTLGAPLLARTLTDLLELDLVRIARLGSPVLVGETYAIPYADAMRGAAIPAVARRVIVKIGGVRPRAMGLFVLAPEEVRSTFSIVAGMTRFFVRRLGNGIK